MTSFQVKAVRPERDALAIRFPRVEGYRVELPEERLTAEFNEDSVLELTPDLVGATETQNSGIIGEKADLTLAHTNDVRPSQVLYELTSHLVLHKWRDANEDPKLHLFGQLKRIAKQWLDGYLVCKGGTYPAQLKYKMLADVACNRIIAVINHKFVGERPIKAVLDPYNPTGSTSHVNFTTSKRSRWQTDARRCHVNWVILDSDWEAEFCRVAESHPRVRAYVKNHSLGLEVPYRYGSQTRTYLPDFIVLVDDGHGDNDLLHLIVEIKGYRREDAKEKKTTMGEYISRKIESAEWGDGVVTELASYIQRHQPNARGFTRSSLFRMRQFYETYRDNEKVAALLRQLPWTHHLMILGRSRYPEEREFYLRMAVQERWRSRELDRQIKAALFERAVLNPPKVAAALRQIHPTADTVFKDRYVLDFLQMPVEHSEADLHSGLLRNLGRFITELGRDFCFIGSEYPLQVGGRDFALDLLFFHRGLNCLVAIELKVDDFQPEHLGKLEFYLEALDRDVRKSHERPAIGLLLCATKDTEVVEYALSRSVSPTLIAEYQSMLPDKALLRAKLHEFYQLLAPPDSDTQETVIAKPKKRKAGRKS